MAFVDTNVLVYAHDTSDPAKQARARAVLEDLWANGTGLLSTQVLQEFYVVATGKQRIAMAPALAREIVGTYSAWPIVTIDPTLILGATWIHETRSISFWDALILESARVGGAAMILSEDLGHGETIGGVRVLNPFANAT